MTRDHVRYLRFSQQQFKSYRLRSLQIRSKS